MIALDPAINFEVYFEVSKESYQTLKHRKTISVFKCFSSLADFKLS